ncbi:MAG: translation initiation factor 2 [Firmicutes bacterium]|nr:translation initiation factor 2 [Bacillota bacterium]MCL5780273.1 translation initiation factor 2 [Bacillota bacterium]
MNGNADLQYLQRRIQELEEKIEQLRLSRRVLMNLIEKIEKDKSTFVTRLEKENRKLHKDNYRYAQSLLKQNRRIVELQNRLEDILTEM